MARPELRPELRPGLAPETFRDWYWLKAELVAFCRANGLPTAGAKRELAECIAAFLTDGTVLRPAPRVRTPREPMPKTLTPATPIGQGWTCGERLRAFFETEVGPSFRFNRALITVIKAPAGRTLGDALAVWQASEAEPDRAIAPDLEYNAFTRAYSRAHPDATRAEVRDAWRARRETPRSAWREP